MPEWFDTTGNMQYMRTVAQFEMMNMKWETLGDIKPP